MKRASLSIALSLLPLFAVAQQTPALLRTGELQFADGQTLRGKLLSFETPDSLRWRSDLPATELTLNPAALTRLRFFGYKPEASDSGSILLLTRSGDVLLGEKITPLAKELLVESARHGTLRVPYPAVHSLKRTRSQRVLYDGPVGLAAWTGAVLTPEGVGRVGLAGSMDLKLISGEKRQPTLLPEKLRVDVALQSQGPLDFSLELLSSGTFGPTVDVWKDELVLHPAEQPLLAGSQSLKLEKTQRSLAFTLLWDQKQQRAELWAPQSRRPFASYLLKDKADQSKGSGTGLVITPRSAQLLVKHCRLSAWDGLAPVWPEPAKDHLVTQQGKTHSGSLKLTQAGLIIGSRKALPWSQVESFSHAAEVKREAQMQCLLAQDGTLLYGHLTGATEAGLHWRTAWSREPLRCTITTRLDVSLPHTPQPSALARLPHEWRSGSTLLKGELVTDAQGALAWQLPGATHDLRLADMVASPYQNWLVTLREAVSRSSSAPLLITRTEEALCAEPLSLNEKSVGYTSAWTEQHSIEAASLRAIAKHGVAAEVKGFSDAAWSLLPRKSTQPPPESDSKLTQPYLKPDEALLTPQSTLYHPRLSTLEELQFELKPHADQHYYTLKLGLYASHALDGMTLYFNRSYSELQLMENPQRSYSRQALTGLDSKAGVVIKLRLGAELEVRMNDLPVYRKPVPASLKKGLGIYFTASSVWGNPEYPLKLSSFQARQLPGRLPSITLSETSRTEALSLPRFRKEQPPQHLVLAPTGDLLRGEALAVDAQTLHFRSGLEELPLPMSRVQQLLWLDPPLSKGKPAVPKREKRTWVLLRDGSHLQLKDLQSQAGHVSGSSPSFGSIRVPLAEVVQLGRSEAPLLQGFESYHSWTLQAAPEPVLPEKSGTASHLIGKTAPPVSLPYLEEKQRFVLAEQKGSVVVLDFWATWCAPCIAALPEVSALVSSLKDRGVKLLCINQGEAASVVKRFLTTRQWQLPVVMDGDSAVSESYSAMMLPYTVVVGRDGKVSHVQTGHSSSSTRELKAAIEKCLGEP